MIPLLLSLIESLTHFGVLHGDSDGYLSMVKVFRGTASPIEAEVVHWHGMLRPVVPALALPLSYVVNYRDAIGIVNVGFALLGTTFTFLFARRLLDSIEAGFVSAVLFVSAVPMLAYGTAILTDGPGYAMIIVSVYCLLFVLEQKPNFQTAIFSGMVVGIGLLTKETLVIVLVFLSIRYLLHRGKMRFGHVAIVFAVSLGLALVWSYMVGFNYLMVYQGGLAFQGPGYKGALIVPRAFALSAVHAFYLALPFAFLAFFTIDTDRLKTVVELALSALTLLVLWPTSPEGRLTFLTFPAILPLAALGIGQSAESLAGRPLLRVLNRRWWIVLILLAAIIYTNYFTRRLYFRLPW
jgi:4-amino-4-deoxy-L-arabinose transferase-like glycosyltransferase